MTPGAERTGASVANFSPSQVTDPINKRKFDQVASVFNTLLRHGAVVIVTSFQKGWTPLAGFKMPGYRVWPSGEIELVGEMVVGTSGLTAFVLPAAPNSPRVWGVAAWNSGTAYHSLLQVDSHGNVIPTFATATKLSLDGVRFFPGT